MATISGITQNARNAIVTSLQNYEKNLRSDYWYGYAESYITNIVKGPNAQKQLKELIRTLMNDYREEIANQIDAIEKIANNLESNYAKIDSNTTFTAKS